MTRWDYWWSTYSVDLRAGGWELRDDAANHMQEMGEHGWELVTMSLAPLVSGGGGGGGGGAFGASVPVNPIWINVGSFVALAVYKRPRPDA